MGETVCYIDGTSRTKKSGFKTWKKDFPGSPVVKTLSFTAEGIGLIPGQGT